MADTTVIIPAGRELKFTSDTYTVFNFKKECKLSLIPDNEYFIFADAPEKLKEEDLDATRAALKVHEFVYGVENKGGFLDFCNKVLLKIAAGTSFGFPRGVFGVRREVLFSTLGERAESFKYKNTTLALFDALYEKQRVTPIMLSDTQTFGFARAVRYLWDVFLSSHSLKYIFSSVVAFVIDYIILLFLHGVLPIAPLEIGALVAWAVSSISNFFINRSFVFHSNAPIKRALVEYYGLAGIVFVLKTYVLIEFLTRAVHLNISIAKPIAEVAFFIGNYFIQKIFIFKKK